MFIEIKELQLHPVDWDEQLSPGVIDLGADITQRAPLRTTGRAHLIEEHRGKHNTINDIRVSGDLATDLEIACARCLEPVIHPVTRSFDLLYRPRGVDAGQDELSVPATDAEIGYYDGTGLLLEDALREQVLLALPLKAICREDCKGLCPHCGKNLNLEPCSCAQQVQDPRWSPLKELRAKLEQ